MPAFQFILHDLELNLVDRDFHLRFLRESMAKADDEVFFSVFKQRLLPMIFKQRDLCQWFMQHVTEVYGEWRNEKWVLIGCLEDLNLLSMLTICSMIVEKSATAPNWRELIAERKLAEALIHADERVSRQKRND